MGNRQKDVKRSQIPTKEAAELEEPDCRTQRTHKVEGNGAMRTSYPDPTRPERLTAGEPAP